VHIAPHQCIEVFSKIDEDGGGSITFGELCQWSENCNPFITATMQSYFLFRYLEFNQPPLIEVKLSKKEIIGRLKQQKDNIRESKPQAQQVAATLSIQNIYTHTS
jgi:hypothetical protein